VPVERIRLFVALVVGPPSGTLGETLFVATIFVLKG
jgi:hypothetical protein